MVSSEKTRLFPVGGTCQGTFAEKHLLKPHTSTFVTVLVQKNGASSTKLWKMQEYIN